MSILSFNAGQIAHFLSQAQDIGGSLSISRLSDVQITNLANGEILQYNTSTNKWENVTVTITTVDGGTY